MEAMVAGEPHDDLALLGLDSTDSTLYLTLLPISFINLCDYLLNLPVVKSF